MSRLGRATIKKEGVVPPVRMWLYGTPNAGKTHFAKQFPKPLLLSTDGNYVYETIPANSVDAWDVGPLAKDEQKSRAFLNLVEDLRTTDHGFETVILDLVDGVHRLAVAHYRKLLKITHESDLQWGKAYSVITDNFIAAIEQLFKLPLNVIIISHEDVVTIKPKNKAEYTILRPELNEKFHDIIEGYCNLVSRVFKDTDEHGVSHRMLSLSPKDNEYGINRLGQADDLILTHNANNYADFFEVWKEMNRTRDAANASLVVNTVRVQAEKDIAEAKKEEALDELERKKAEAAERLAARKAERDAKAAELAAKKAEAAVEVVEEVIEEPVVQPEVVVEAPKKEAKPKATVKKSAEKIDDGEPELVVTPETQAKLDRIAQIKAAAAAKKANK